VINLGSAVANKLLFWGLLITYVAVMFYYIPRVYNYGFVASYLVALVFASAGMITLVALVWESRVVWPLTSTYASAWVNDLFVLCVVTGVLSVMHRSLPSTYHEVAWWPYLAAILAVGAGVFFHFVIDGAYPSDVANSPTHLAHSFGAFPIFSYLLLRGAPGLIFGTKGIRAFAHGNVVGIALCIVVLLGIVAFFAMFPVMDVQILHTYAWGAHGPYDWQHLRLQHKLTPQNPGWMPDVLRPNGAQYARH
jgi:hypothetical protein